MFKTGKWQVLKLKEVFEMWTCESFKTFQCKKKLIFIIQKDNDKQLNCLVNNKKDNKKSTGIQVNRYRRTVRQKDLHTESRATERQRDRETDLPQINLPGTFSQ